MGIFVEHFAKPQKAKAPHSTGPVWQITMSIGISRERISDVLVFARVVLLQRVLLQEGENYSHKTRKKDNNSVAKLGDYSFQDIEKTFMDCGRKHIALVN
mmetsp:Transcript_31178/g.65049  ORF Transcript_31178/g.65049 Transcript_31178/m.65049 type:complete len:100 (-) Transcript_31178:2857-3156(-)